MTTGTETGDPGPRKTTDRQRVIRTGVGTEITTATPMETATTAEGPVKGTAETKTKEPTRKMSGDRARANPERRREGLTGTAEAKGQRKS